MYFPPPPVYTLHTPLIFISLYSIPKNPKNPNPPYIKSFSHLLSRGY